MLTLKNIKKDYSSGENVVHALRGVSLSFRPNEFVSILGASGCGKTTMLNIIGGLDRYSDGDLVINGVSTKDYKDRDWDVYRNHRIGFVFQSYNLIPHQTVLGNVELALTIAGVSKSERRRRAMETLEKVGLKAEMKKRPNQLSGGQMQRVAIARALVNNPEILLADEPTGALDTETSVQIMDLIREIAGERLVIMVTHNPELAEQYSSRIVRLSDGLVVSDSNPYEELEQPVLPQETQPEQPVLPQETQPEQETQAATNKKSCGCKKGNREKSAMSYGTALGLSGRNLVAKKARTALTGIAGSIGIIGVSLVLALRGGFSAYIAATEKDMLSEYPLTISETSFDYAGMMQSMEGSNVTIDPTRLHDSIYVNSFLSKLANNMMSTNTITQEYLDYLDTLDSNTYYARRMEYGGDIGDNLFQSFSYKIDMQGQEMNFTGAMSLNELVSMFGSQLQDHAVVGKYQAYSSMFTSFMEVTYEMPNNPEYILSQYDLVAGEYPDAASENEFVLVLNNDGGMTDLTLAQLGILSMEEVLELFTKDEEGEEDVLKYITYEELLSKEYTYYPNDAIYTQVAVAVDARPVGSWTRTNYFLTKPQQSGTTMKISGILRAKETTSYGSLSSGLAYMPGFTQKYLSDSRSSAVAIDTAQKEGKKQEIYSQSFTDLMTGGVPNRFLVEQYTLRDLGGEEMPSEIQFFVKDFACKDVITAHLDRWNNEIKADDEAAQIQYSDTVAVLMLLVRGMLDAVTYVLVAFTAISLVVSSIMIGIITYVSVVERTKEIGVLRSLGARKKDIRNLFNAETFIIGLAAGIFGIATTYLLSIPINAILYALTEIGGLAALPFGQAILMVCVSVGLTLISGLIPANAAANKDPVIALRTE